MSTAAPPEPAIGDLADDQRPLVAGDPGNRPLWIGIATILAIGLILFTALESRRERATAPAVRPRAADLARSSGPPPLYVPPDPLLLQAAPPPPPAPPPASAATTLPTRLPTPQAPPAYTPPPAAAVPPPIAVAPPERADTTAAIVYDVSGPDPAAAPGTAQGGTSPAPAIATRARASRVRNRATIVPQGTLIPAVLETALDSTQPGQARALVTRDVVNLVGKRVLIPRGSRLFGTYQGSLEPGQKRALVQWSRLVRPDGVAIAIDSPAADRLGRAGIEGRVNSYFFERFGGALLQSALDVGTLVASRAISDSTVLVNVPTTGQGSSPLLGPPPKPTLRVRPGTSITVFVTRDLDFTGVERTR